MKFKTLLLIVSIAFGTHALADVVTSDEKQETQTKKLEDLPDSSPSSPPLATDDPGTPGPMGIEVNFFGDCDTTSVTSDCRAGLDANLGVGEYLQLRLSKEAVEEKAQGEPTFHGSAPTSIGVKYRFYDTRVLKLAVYPSVQFDDETRRLDDSGNPIETEGRSVYLPIIVSRQFGRTVLVANVGYSFNTDYSEKSALVTSLAAGRAVSETMRIMGEVAAQKPKDAITTTELRLGFVKEVFPDEKSRYETAVFGSIGHSLGATEDGLTHTSFLVGVTVARKPAGQQE